MQWRDNEQGKKHYFNRNPGSRFAIKVAAAAGFNAGIALLDIYPAFAARKNGSTKNLKRG